MWPFRVVLLTPRFDRPSGMIHRDEPVLVQTLVAELAVEALDVLVLDRLARPDERQARRPPRYLLN